MSIERDELKRVLGKLAYETYCSEAGLIGSDWKSLPDEVKRRWIGVGRSVERRVKREMSENRCSGCKIIIYL
jgi:hypothetical protein